MSSTREKLMKIPKNDETSFRTFIFIVSRFRGLTEIFVVKSIFHSMILPRLSMISPKPKIPDPFCFRKLILSPFVKNVEVESSVWHERRRHSINIKRQSLAAPKSEPRISRSRSENTWWVIARIDERAILMTGRSWPPVCMCAQTVVNVTTATPGNEKLHLLFKPIWLLFNFSSRCEKFYWTRASECFSDFSSFSSILFSPAEMKILSTVHDIVEVEKFLDENNNYYCA